MVLYIFVNCLALQSSGGQHGPSPGRVELVERLDIDEKLKLSCEIDLSKLRLSRSASITHYAAKSKLSSARGGGLDSSDGERCIREELRQRASFLYFGFVAQRL